MGNPFPIPMVRHWDGPGLDAWDPWHPSEVALRLKSFDAPWCVVAGWAVDLFLGQKTRDHEDLEIEILRGDFARVRGMLAGFAFHTVGDGDVRRLGDREEPAPEKHQNWVLDPDANAWQVDVMLEPGDEETWIFRRDESITAPRSF